MRTEEHRAAMADRFPLNYIADPDDMARAAIFLLSDESRWTTYRLNLPGAAGALH